MKFTKLLVAFVVALLLTACGATQNLSIFSLDDNDLKSMLMRQLPQFDRQVDLLNVPVAFSVDNIDVEIGPEQRNVISLSIDAQALVSAFVIDYPIDMALIVEGRPRYDSAQDAIFLEEVNLINASADAGGYKGNIKTLNSQTMTIINQFLKDNPVYRLDKSDPRMALLSNIPLDLVISQGKLQLSPQL